MEFWESAILIVGGVWLVSYMAKQRQSAQTSVVGTSILGSAGTSNTSNLTDITNTAGGYPTTYGEPLMPPQPPISPMRPVYTGSPAGPAPNAPKIPVSIISTGTFSAQPIYRTPTISPAGGRPIGVSRLQLL